MDKIFQKYPALINLATMDNLSIVLGMFGIDGQNLFFNVTNTNAVTSALTQNNKEELIPLFDELKNIAIPFSEDELRDYHFRKDSRWKSAFEVLKNHQIRTLQLNPVGVYIGIRQLARICEMSIPMSIFYSK